MHQLTHIGMRRRWTVNFRSQRNRHQMQIESSLLTASTVCSLESDAISTLYEREPRRVHLVYPWKRTTLENSFNRGATFLRCMSGELLGRSPWPGQVNVSGVLYCSLFAVYDHAILIRSPPTRLKRLPTASINKTHPTKE